MQQVAPTANVTHDFPLKQRNKSNRSEQKIWYFFRWAHAVSVCAAHEVTKAMVTFSVAGSINDTANCFTPNESLSINIYYYYIYRNSIEVLSVQRRQKSNDFCCMVVMKVA